MESVFLFYMIFIILFCVILILAHSEYIPWCTLNNQLVIPVYCRTRQSVCYLSQVSELVIEFGNVCLGALGAIIGIRDVFGTIIIALMVRIWLF